MLEHILEIIKILHQIEHIGVKMTYMEYPNRDLLTNWAKLIKMTQDEILHIKKEWENIQVENRKIYEQFQSSKTSRIKKIQDILRDEGIVIPKTGYNNWFTKNISHAITIPCCPQHPYLPSRKQTVNNIELNYTSSSSDILELYNWLKHNYSQKIKAQEFSELVNKKLVHEATKLGLDINQSYNDLDNYFKNEYSKTIEDGDEFSCDCNDCETWYFGSYRCSCGNRRIDSYIDGNIIDGYFLRAEAY